MITNGRLLKWFSQMQQAKQMDHFSLQPEFDGSKYLKFEAKYGKKIKAIQKKLTSMQSEFFVMENGSPKRIMNEGKSMVVMLEGKTFEEADKAIMPFLNTPIGSSLNVI